MKVFLVFLTAIAFIAFLGGRGYLLPPAKSTAELSPDTSNSILIQRPHYFPPREFHTFACGGILIDLFCWTRDPTFYSAGKKVITLETQGRPYEVESQFIFVNDHFYNEKFKEIVFVLAIDGNVTEFYFDKIESRPQRWSIPELIGAQGDRYCFAYDDDSGEPEASMAAVCINIATSKIHVEKLVPTASGASFALDFIGSSKGFIDERFCKGESRNEYLAQLLLGKAC